MENKLRKYLPKKNQWMFALLIGILLVVIAIPTTSTSKTEISSYPDRSTSISNTERRLISILEKMQGVGRADVMITEAGIVILAQGGGNAVVIQEITGVIKALFEVDTHKIKVIEMK